MPTHKRIPMSNTKVTYPNQSIDYDMAQVVVPGHPAYRVGAEGAALR